MSRRRALETFATGYLDELASLGYDDLVEEQPPPPHGSLACGAAGVAWALWRAGVARQAPALVDAASRWVTEADARRDAAGAFDAPHAATSVFFGPSGLDLASALLGDASAAERFAAAARASVGGPAELFLGTAGFLLGATMLAAQGADGIDALELELVDAIWATELDEPGMAHGDAGLLYALVGVAERRQQPVSDAVLERLERLEPATGEGRFCAGPAGHAMLWVKVAGQTGEAAHRARARDLAETTYRELNGHPDFCCGLVGSAYAMLAMSRLEPSGPWLERAEELAITALASEVEPDWVYGLLKGETGLLCLALDLLDGQAVLPALELP